MFLILVSNYLYKKDKTLRSMFYLSASIFYADFVFRFLAFYKEAYFYNFAEVSSVLGIIALGLLTLEVFLFVRHKEKVVIPKEVKNVYIPTMRRAAFVTVVVSLAMVAFVFFAADYYSNFNVAAEKSVRESLYKEGTQLTMNCSEIFQQANSILETLSSGYSLRSGDISLIKSKIREAFYANKEMFSSLTFMNNEGVIVYTYPYKSASGRSVKNQPHIALILKSHQPVVSDPIKTVQGIYAVVIHQPVFAGDKFIGSAAGLVRLDYLNNMLSAYKSKNVGFVISESGIVIASSYKELFLKKLSLIPEKFFQQNIRESNKFVFLDKTFYVDTYFPKFAFESKKSMVETKIILSLVVLLVLTLLLFYSMLEIVRKSDVEKGKAVEKAIYKEREEKEKYLDVYTRLAKLLSFFKKVSLSEPEEEFFKDFLGIAISVMPDAEKGTVAFNGGNGYLRFVASYGYDLEKLKKLRIPFEKEKDITKKGCIPIIKRIYESDERNFSSEGIKILKEIGNYGIKSTLTAPIYVGNEYAGSIFVDNFNSENAFDSEDVKVAEAISQIASLFTEGKEYVKRMKHRLIVSSTISEIVSLLSTKERRKNLARIALPVLRKNVLPDIILFVVNIRLYTVRHRTIVILLC